MEKQKVKVELFVNFLYPGIILKGDSFTVDGRKVSVAGKPIDEATILELKKANVQKIYYDRPVFSGKTSGSNMLVSETIMEDAINVAQELELAVKNRAILPEKQINIVVGNMVESISATDDAILNLMDLKDYDDYTYTHSVNVSLISILFAKRLGYNPEGLKVVGVAGMLHDIGKTMVPLEILNKPTRLNDMEYDIMKKHPVFGYEILKANSVFSPLIQKIVLLHHEQVVGKGYPLALRGEQMGEAAQIVSISDAFDAITSARSYKASKPFWFALVEISKMSTVNFVPRLAKTFIKDMPLYLTDGEIFRKGSFVSLNTGEVGEVVDFKTPQTISPIVSIYLNSKKEAMRYPIQINLEYDDSRYIEYVIDEGPLTDKLIEIRDRLMKKKDASDIKTPALLYNEPNIPVDKIGDTKVDKSIFQVDENILK